MAAHMWRYFSEAKGVEDALVDQYPKTLEADLELRTALAQLRNARRVIDSIMSDYADGSRDAPPGTEVEDRGDDY